MLRTGRTHTHTHTEGLIGSVPAPGEERFGRRRRDPFPVGGGTDAEVTVVVVRVECEGVSIGFTVGLGVTVGGGVIARRARCGRIGGRGGKLARVVLHNACLGGIKPGQACNVCDQRAVVVVVSGSSSRRSGGWLTCTTVASAGERLLYTYSRRFG